MPCDVSICCTRGENSPDTSQPSTTARMIKGMMRRVLGDVDVALMQGAGDANRLISLGLAAAKAKVTGNVKFDIGAGDTDTAAVLAERFGFESERPVIIAASTHQPEERWILDAYCSMAAEPAGPRPRLVIAPRHPERFEDVMRLLREFKNDEACEWRRYRTARRSAAPEDGDRDADVILLDSIGELRELYRYADVAFVGGSLIPHGGQSVLEPAAAGVAIVTGPHTENFADAIAVFRANGAIVQLEKDAREEAIPDSIYLAVSDLLEDADRRRELGRNAAAVMANNRGATERTVEELAALIGG